MKRNDKEQMRQLYQQWQSSGLSMKNFSKQHGITPTTFYYWAKTIKKQELPLAEKKCGSGFSQIPVPTPVGEPDGKAVAVISFPSGARLELYFPVEASIIKFLVQ